MEDSLLKRFANIEENFYALAKEALGFLEEKPSPPFTLSLSNFVSAMRTLSPRELVVWCAIVEASEGFLYCDKDEPMLSFVISECAPANFSSNDLPDMIRKVEFSSNMKSK